MSAGSSLKDSSDGRRPPLKKVVLGSRGSELARAQTRLVEESLRAAWPPLEIQIQIVTTRGDESSARVPLEHISAPQAGRSRYNQASGGRKGLFTTEIEHALKRGEIDVAIHSAKDLPSELTAELAIQATLPRGPVDDVLVARNAIDFGSLPQSARIATGSVRRQYQLRWKRPDLRVVELRGNVPTRLRKLSENDWDAIVLARAGLERLGYDLTRRHLDFDARRFHLHLLPREEFLPAGGQGIIALQVRGNDARAKGLVEVVNHPKTFLCLRAERHFLQLLHGDCNQPVGVLATISNASMKLRAQVFDLGAMAPRQATVEGTSEEPESLAARLFAQISGG